MPKVRVAAFGVSADGYGDQAEAKIDFGADYGVKHLVLRYAPLEKL